MRFFCALRQHMAEYTKLSTTDLAQEIDDQFLLAKKYLDRVHERMNRQEEMYRSYIDPNNYPNMARVFDPRVFRVIETVTPRIVANEPSGSFYPTESGDEITTQILNALMKYDWRRAEMFPKQVNFVKSMLIFGTAFGRNYWDFREKEKTQMVPKKLNGRLIWTPDSTKKVTVTEFDGPNFEPLNIYDCFPDPNATNMQNMRWFIYRMFKTIDELKKENDARGAEYWKHLDELEAAIHISAEQKKNKQNSGGRPSDIQYREHRRIMLSTQELIGQDESNPDLTILVRYTREGWCFYVPELAGVGDFNGIIREVENPYFHGDFPIVYGVDYPYPGELYGMGEIEPIDRVQRAINAVLNQRLDNVQMTLRTMWKVQKGKQVDMHTLVSAPGNIITTGDMNAVEAIQTPDVTGATFVQTMNYLTSSLQNGSGITDYTVGINKDSNVTNDTAKGAQLIQNEANAQFKLKIQLYNHMVIERIANQWKDLRIQFTTEAQKLRILGEEVQHLRDDTKLSQTDMEGNQIVPGDMEAEAKLNIQAEGFAFLNLLPDDIQPSIVGEYDFVPAITSDQLNDPMLIQDNINKTIDRYMTPLWIQGLAQQGKMLNYEHITRESIKKLNSSVDETKIVVDMPQQQIDPMTGQPVPPQNGIPPQPTEDDIAAMIGQSQEQYMGDRAAVDNFLKGPAESYGTV